MGGWPRWARSLGKGLRASFWRTVFGMLWKAVLGGVGALLLVLLAKSRLGGIDWASLEWWYWPLIVAGGLLALVVVALLFLVIRPRLALHRWRVSEWAGIRRVYPVLPWESRGVDANEKQRSAVEEALREEAKNASKLQLLLASGYRHIGSDREPGILHAVLKDRKGEPFSLEVLLLSPTNSAARASLAPGLSADEYAEGIAAVVWTLSHWKKALGLDISAWFYDEPPIWQMMITDNDVWLLCAHGVPADASTVYCLQRNSMYGLARGIQAVWDRRKVIAKPIDLDTCREPDWRRLKTVPPAGSETKIPKQ